MGEPKTGRDGNRFEPGSSKSGGPLRLLGSKSGGTSYEGTSETDRVISCPRHTKPNPSRSPTLSFSWRVTVEVSVAKTKNSDSGSSSLRLHRLRHLGQGRTLDSAEEVETEYRSGETNCSQELGPVLQIGEARRSSSGPQQANPRKDLGRHRCILRMGWRFAEWETFVRLWSAQYGDDLRERVPGSTPDAPRTNQPGGIQAPITRVEERTVLRSRRSFRINPEETKGRNYPTTNQADDGHRLEPFRKQATSCGHEIGYPDGVPDDAPSV